MSKTYNLCVYIFLTANFFPFLLNRGEMNQFLSFLEYEWQSHKLHSIYLFRSTLIFYFYISEQKGGIIAKKLGIQCNEKSVFQFTFHQCCPCWSVRSLLPTVWKMFVKTLIYCLIVNRDFHVAVSQKPKQKTT